MSVTLVFNSYEILSNNTIPKAARNFFIHHNEYLTTEKYRTLRSRTIDYHKERALFLSEFGIVYRYQQSEDINNGGIFEFDFESEEAKTAFILRWY